MHFRSLVHFPFQVQFAGFFWENECGFLYFFSPVFFGPNRYVSVVAAAVRRSRGRSEWDPWDQEGFWGRGRGGKRKSMSCCGIGFDRKSTCRKLFLGIFSLWNSERLQAWSTPICPRRPDAGFSPLLFPPLLAAFFPDFWESR